MLDIVDLVMKKLKEVAYGLLFYLQGVIHLD